VPAPLSDGEAARLADAQTEISPDTIVTGIEDGKLLGVMDGKVIGVDPCDTGSSGEDIDLLYPVGWQQVTAWLDNKVEDSNGIWLKCNGQTIDINDFPHLTNTSALVMSNKIKALPVMTSNNVPAPYIISASSVTTTTPASYQPYKVFDNNTATWWSSDNFFSTTTGIGDQWIKVNFGKKQNIVAYTLVARNTITYANQHPGMYTLEGSNDDLEWDVIDTRIDIPAPTVINQRFDYVLDSFHVFEYQYYRLHITKLSNKPGESIYAGYVHLGEWELFASGDYGIINIAPVNGQYTYVKAAGSRFLFRSDIGVPNGVLGLDGNGIANQSQLPIRFYAATIAGDGQETEFIVTHNLSSEDLIVQVRDSATLEAVLVDNTLVDSDNVKIVYSMAPAQGKFYRVNIIGWTNNQAYAATQKISVWNDSQTWNDGMIWDDGTTVEPSKTFWKDSQVWDDNKKWEDN